MSARSDIVIEHHAVIDSTNCAARRRYDSGDAPQRFVIVADMQSAGRGTRGRTWSSPPGAGLYMTYAEAFSAAANSDPRVPSTDYTLAAGVACAEAIERLVAVRVRLKAINDLMIGERKLGGILTESIVRGGHMQVLLVGIGINLRRCAHDVPHAPAPPISLDDVTTGPPADRDALLHHILRTLLPRLDAVGRGDAEPVRAAWGEWQQGSVA